MDLIGKTEHVTLTIDGLPVEVVALQGEEEVSKLFSFRLVCAASATGPTPDALLARAARITLDDGFGITRTVTGVIAEAEDELSDEGFALVTLAVRPDVYRLSLGRDCRVFQDLDMVGIAKAILSKTKAPVRYELVRTYRVREYTAQYREDDWTFLSRMLDEEGIYYWFDHDGAETSLVISDDSTLAPDLPGGARVPFAYESGMHATSEVVEELAQEVVVTPTKFTFSSFDPQKPLLKVTATVGDGPLEFYSARGGGPESPAVCAARAKTMLEAANAEGNTAAGISTSVRLIPGMTLEVTDHPLSGFDGKYFIIKASYQVVQRRRVAGGEEEGTPYQCRFGAIAQATPFRSPFDMPKARQPGIQSGVVVGMAGEEVHPDATGRVRVQHYWDREGGRDDKSGKWMRVAQRGVAESMLLPRMGWSVLTFNEEGILDAPSVLARIHDGEHPPPYPLPANKTRVVFKTATTPGGGSHNEIRYEDKDGMEEMFINASRDMSVLALDAKRETVLRDHTRKVGANHAHDVKVDHREEVGNDQSVTISGSEKEDTGPRNKSVVGNESIKVSGTRTLKVERSEGLAVTKDRKLEVGATLIDQTEGQITALAREKRVIQVGGAMVKKSDMSISEDVGKASKQDIGGSKFELVKLRRALEVKTVYTEKVTSAIILKTDKSYNEHADNKSRWIVGGKLDGSAPELWVEASEKIEIKCGSTMLTITKDAVEIKADNLDLTAAATLDAVTKEIVHNR